MSLTLYAMKTSRPSKKSIRKKREQLLSRLMRNSLFLLIGIRWDNLRRKDGKRNVKNVNRKDASSFKIQSKKWCLRLLKKLREKLCKNFSRRNVKGSRITVEGNNNLKQLNPLLLHLLSTPMLDVMVVTPILSLESATSVVSVRISTSVRSAKRPNLMTTPSLRSEPQLKLLQWSLLLLMDQLISQSEDTSES